jgi:hypothetical protein
VKTLARRKALEQALSAQAQPPTASELVMLLRESIERKPMLADTYHRIKAALARWDAAMKAAK